MRRRAFTIIELLIVIGIIVVLVGILIPTMGAIVTRGYKTRTLGTMNNLQAALTMYYAHYHAYPGPASAAFTTTGSGLSGAQNLYDGLNGGVDNSVTNPDGSHPTLPPFLTIMRPGSGKYADITSFSPVVFIDAYGESLPILYYRRTPGAVKPSDFAPTATSTAAYYLNENIQFTGAAMLKPFDPTTGGTRPTVATTYDQTTGGLSGANGVNYLANLVVTNPASSMTSPPSNPQVHGGYMLLSAGADRFYGTPDDTVIVGGD